jgi:hypothetical protein
VPGKALATMVIFMMSLGLGVSVGQILVHDIIPTFLSEKKAMEDEVAEVGKPVTERGDLFAEPTLDKKEKPFYETDEFVFALKFTHIHTFGMSLIFIFMGAIALLVDVNPRVHTLLIVLPFVGIIIDLAAVWLKLFVSPVFFWLHIPGFGIFGTIFAIDSILALWQMWGPRSVTT